VLKVGRPGFNSLTESDQKTLKVSIHFTAFLLSVQHKRDSEKIKLLSSLVVSLGKALNEIASTYEWIDW